MSQSEHRGPPRPGGNGSAWCIAALLAGLASCRDEPLPTPPAASSSADETPSSAPSVSSAATAVTKAAEWRSCLLDGVSPCVSEAPVRVREDWVAWSDWLGEHARKSRKQHPDGVTECRWIAELDQVLLCASNDSESMNPPLTRAAIFTETRPRVVVPRGSPLYQHLVRVVGGFDFPKVHPVPPRPGLLDFYAAVDRGCATSKPACLDPREQAMRELVERAWSERPGFVLITFAHDGAVDDETALRHELRHAQYFTSSTYRQAIRGYWESLSDRDRAEVRWELGPSYDAKDDDLMQNELQAYSLESVSLTSRSRFARPHGPGLQRMLDERGVEPIEVRRR